MFAWLLLFNQWSKLKPLYLPGRDREYSSLWLPPGTWIVGSRNPSWAHFFFVHEQWERFTTTQHGRVQPWYFFIPPGGFVLGFFPGSASSGRLRPLGGSRGGWARRREKR